jgi:hypothetical protein
MYKSWTKYIFKYLTLLILVVYNCWYAVKKLSICVDINRVGLQQPWFQWTKQFHFFLKKKKEMPTVYIWRSQGEDNPMSLDMRSNGMAVAKAASQTATMIHFRRK